MSPTPLVAFRRLNGTAWSAPGQRDLSSTVPVDPSVKRIGVPVFEALDPQPTYQQWTATTTPTDLPVVRVTRTRVSATSSAPAGAWVVDAYQPTRTGDHLISADSPAREPSTKYDYEVTFTDPTGEYLPAVKSGTFTTAAVDAPPVDPTPEPTDPGGYRLPLDRSDYPSTNGWTKLVWLPPNAAGNAYSVPVGYQVQRNLKLTLQDNVDYLIYAPVKFEGTLLSNGGLTIDGGRSYICFGLHIKFTTSNFGPPFTPGRNTAPAGSDPGSSRNRALRVNGRTFNNTESLFRCLEGLYIEGTYTWEGVEYECKGDRGPGTTFMRQNDRVDQINVVIPASGGHWGGDAFQNFRGAGRTIVRNASWMNLHYQGWFYQPCGADGTWFPDANLRYYEISNVHLYGARVGHAQLLWDTKRGRDFQSLPRKVDRVYADSASSVMSIQDDYLRADFYNLVNWGPLPAQTPVPAALAGVNYPYMTGLAAA